MTIGEVAFAAAVGTVCLIGLGTFGLCAVYVEEIVSGRFVCDSRDRVFDLLMLALAITRRGST